MLMDVADEKEIRDIFGEERVLNFIYIFIVALILSLTIVFILFVDNMSFIHEIIKRKKVLLKNTLPTPPSGKNLDINRSIKNMDPREGTNPNS